MEHIFWLEHYPRSINGIIEYLARTDKVFCICYDDNLFGNRASMGWTSDLMLNVDVIYLNKLKNKTSFLKDFIDKHIDATHYVMGIRASNISKIVNKYVFSNAAKHVFMLAERPYSYNKNFISRFMLKMMYLWYGFKFRNKLTGVFAMGLMGVNSYKTWAHGNVYPFIYPRFNNIDLPPVKEVSIPIKVLYVGQLDYRKGIDILVDVFNSLPATIQLDVVGANGNIQKKIISMIENIPNINYLGVWNSKDVAKNSSNYNVCIIPSRYDGWGMFVMEALEAGVGVITTDRTGSKDLVYASGAGKVVKAGSYGELRSVLLDVINNPSLTIGWKYRAREYKCKISQDSVGKYFKEIVCSKELLSKKKINCPWL